MFLMECLCLETVRACGVFQNLSIYYNTKTFSRLFLQMYYGTEHLTLGNSGDFPYFKIQF